MFIETQPQPSSVRIPPNITPQWEKERGEKVQWNVGNYLCNKFEGLHFQKRIWEHLIPHSNICQRIRNRSRFFCCPLTFKHVFSLNMFFQQVSQRSLKVNLAKKLHYTHLCFGQLQLLLFLTILNFCSLLKSLVKRWPHFSSSRGCAQILQILSSSSTFIDSVVQRRQLDTFSWSLYPGKGLSMKFISCY